jgi:hypothetical protein
VKLNFQIPIRELNALTTPELVTYIERKLNENEVTKFVPEDDVLEVAYKKAFYMQELNEQVKKIISKLKKDNENIKIPKDLKEKILKQIEGTAFAWDEIIPRIIINEEIKAINDQS